MRAAHHTAARTGGVLHASASLLCGVVWLTGTSALAGPPDKTAESAGSVVDTVHNLSAQGPGPVRAGVETEVCVFCHAPHGASRAAPLWNRSSAAGFDLSHPGQQSADATQCLSCHDGTVALGEVRSREDAVSMRGADRLVRDRDHGALTGSGAHPPEAGGCTTCHDPHRDENHWPGRVPRFWRDVSVTETCVRCHDLSLTHRGHESEYLPLGCASCHRAHGRRDTPLLPEAGVAFCIGCHGDREQAAAMVEAGLMARSAEPDDVAAEFEKVSAHPLGRWLPARRAGDLTALEPTGCSICHRSHGGWDSAARGSRLAATKGADELDDHRLCLECHGGEGQVSALADDLEAIFASTMSASSHPVGRRSPGRTPTSLGGEGAREPMTCGSCHGSDDPDSAAGPHGSRYRSLLRMPYWPEDTARLGESEAGLCTSCHDASALTNTGMGWSGHRLHVDIAQEACRSCHDPHGSRRYPGLISLGEDIRDELVRPGADGRLEYEPGPGQGRCRLSCHGVEHDGTPGDPQFVPFNQPKVPR